MCGALIWIARDQSMIRAFWNALHNGELSITFHCLLEGLNGILPAHRSSAVVHHAERPAVAV
jgi:hypothetical protein